MYRLYLIVVVVLMVAFGAVYIPFERGLAAKAQARIEARLAEERAAEQQRLAEEAAARAADEERRLVREKEEAERKARELAVYEARNGEIEAEAAKLTDEVVAMKTEIERRKIEIADAREKRLDMERRVLEAEKANEQLRIEARLAELEIARLTQMLAQRAGRSAEVFIPLQAPPGAATR